MKELKIEIPEGHEIDTENSCLESGVVKFKKKVKFPCIATDGKFTILFIDETHGTIIHIEGNSFFDVGHSEGFWISVYDSKWQILAEDVRLS